MLLQEEMTTTDQTCGDAFVADHNGEAACITLAGRRDVLKFHKCQNIAHRPAQLDNWLLEQQEYGQDMPEDLLYEMFLDILPDQVAKEVRLEKDIATADQALKYVLEELHRLNNERLAHVHAAEHQRRLAPQRRPSGYVHAAISPPGNPVEQTVAAIERNVRTTQATRTLPPARSSSGPPSELSYPKWKDGACWHCGKTGRKANQYRMFMKLKEQTGGKRPHNYVSAHECDRKATWDCCRSCP